MLSWVELDIDFLNYMVPGSQPPALIHPTMALVATKARRRIDSKHVTTHTDIRMGKT